MNPGDIGMKVEEAFASYEARPLAHQLAVGALLGLVATLGGLAVFAGVLFLLVTVF